MAQANRRATPGDMIRSLAVIIIPLVIVAVLFTDLPDDKPVETLNWQPVLAVARRDAPFPVLAPTNLPEGWRATQAEWVETGEPFRDGEPSVRNQWSLGFLTPDDVFIGLDQGDRQPDNLVEEQSRDGAPDGQSTVNGQTWERLLSPDGRTRSLVRREPAATTVVAGDLGYDALEAYVATLATG
ncbi:MAG TPA: DUF4245 domain-containing protein [Propionibacteriaceae bacterium]|nr:DUF4245 domain-containing protein [Propionibacteriaceae bacterium]